MGSGKKGGMTNLSIAIKMDISEIGISVSYKTSLPYNLTSPP
jgi:hypothetical protein